MRLGRVGMKRLMRDMTEPRPDLNTLGNAYCGDPDCPWCMAGHAHETIELSPADVVAVRDAVEDRIRAHALGVSL